VPKVGICASVPLAGELAGSGAEFLEENVQSFLAPESSDQAFEPNLRAAGACPLPVAAANCFLPGALKCVGPSVDRARLMRYAEKAFERARMVGIATIVFGSGGARRVPEGFSRDEALDQFVDLLRCMAPLARERGVTLAVEPLNRGECNLLNKLEAAALVVERCGSRAVRLLADIYHMAREKEPPSELERFGGLLAHVHVAEAKDRTAPGVAGDDFRPYFAALARAGYGGAISIECRWKDVRSEAPRAVEIVRRQWREAAGG